jgi:3-methyladenine DNA glycosylase Tag
MNKCTWALSSPSEEHYHDLEWGVPVHDDRLLLEFLILEGAQAGLSWSIILMLKGLRGTMTRKSTHYWLTPTL